MRSARFISHVARARRITSPSCAAGGVVFLPESFQQFLELGGIFAEGAQSHLLRLRVKPVAQVGGADASAPLAVAGPRERRPFARLAAILFSVIVGFFLKDM